ncbi:MAG: Minf_1886 family protein [bacterium]
MKRPRFEDAIQLIIKEDPRYPVDAYVFLRLALDFTIRALKKPDHGPDRHITGHELLDGIRQYSLQEFGPVTRTVLADWGITRTEDFGALVFNLVKHGLLGKTDQDKIEDFANGYTFQDAFTEPFLPSSLKGASKPTKRTRTYRLKTKEPS